MRLLAMLATLLLSVALVGCAPEVPQSPGSGQPGTGQPDAEQPATDGPAAEPAAEATGIYAVELTDVVSGDVFTLADLKGKPVLLHPFAMW